MDMRELKAMYAEDEHGKERSYRIHFDTNPPQMDVWHGSYSHRTSEIPQILLDAVKILRIAGLYESVNGIGVWESEDQFGLFNVEDAGASKSTLKLLDQNRKV